MLSCPAVAHLCPMPPPLLRAGALAPPPWLHRMRKLGLPPGYMEAVEAAPTAADGAADRAAAAAARKAAAAAAAEAEEDFIALDHDTPDSSEDEPLHLECSVQFPGVSAPVPEGVDAAAWAAAPAPPPRQAEPLLPPGFGSYSTPPQQQGAAADGRRSWGSGEPRFEPLRGLHPPSDSSTGPGVHHSQHPPASHAAPLPPGYGWQAAQQQHPPQAHGRPLPPPPPPPEDVYAVSRSDPGHLLVYDPRGLAQQQQAYYTSQYQPGPPPPMQYSMTPPPPPQYAPMPPQYHPALEQQQYWPQPQPGQGYNQPYQGGDGWQAQAQAQAQQEAAAAQEAAQAYQQRLWRSDGR